jgi:hypothetical protein
VILTARSEGYCDLVRTNSVTVVDCITPATYTLLASTSGFCEGDAGVTFALDDTESGIKYRLYNGAVAVGSELSGTGSAATFTGTYSEGVYTAVSVADGTHCAVSMSGSHNISKNLLPTLEISQPADVCYNSGDIVFTVNQSSGLLTWISTSGGVVSGTNNEIVTFASGASTGTKAVTSQTYTNAPACYSAQVTKLAAVNLLPDNHTVTAGLRCGPGTVTLTASSTNALIDWYANVSGGTSLTTGASYTLEITTSTTYYVEARFEATSCVSTERIPLYTSTNECCHKP